MKKFLLILLILSLALSATAAFADYGAVLNRNARICTGADLKTKAGKLPKYTAVTVKSVKSGISEISWNGLTGWTRSKYLESPWETLVKALKEHGEETTERTPRYVRKTCYMYDYPSTKANRLEKVKKGTVLIGCGERNGWSIVTDDKESFYGYIKTSNLDGLSGGDGSRFHLKNYPYFFGNML